MIKHSFGVIGGGQRYAELRRLLEADGQRVFSYGAEAGVFADTSGPHSNAAADTALQAALNAEIVILPLPLCGADGFLNSSGRPLSIQEILDRVQGNNPHILTAGMVPPQWIAAAEQRGLPLIDYMRRESLAIANASATAEAALQVTMEHLEEVLAGKDCLILGFGRIGKLLAHRLHGLSARVTVAARRREDRAWARAYGYDALHISNIRDLAGNPDKITSPGQSGNLDENGNPHESGNLPKFEIVYNTIPAPVLDRAPLAALPPDCLLIDLASQTGIDFPAAAELGLRTVWARGLPGRLLPRTAAAIIRDEIYEILRESPQHSAGKTG